MESKSEFFKKCLERQSIRQFSRGKSLAPKEIDLARADLKRGKATFNEEDYKWATIQAYYSMFHSARALLYRKSYREKSHACLIEAVRVLYVEKGQIGYWLIEALQEAKRLREDADYYGEYTKGSASKLLKSADEFLNKAREIVKQENVPK